MKNDTFLITIIVVFILFMVGVVMIPVINPELLEKNRWTKTEIIQIIKEYESGESK